MFYQVYRLFEIIMFVIKNESIILRCSELKLRQKRIHCNSILKTACLIKSISAVFDVQHSMHP